MIELKNGIDVFITKNLNNGAYTCKAYKNNELIKKMVYIGYSKAQAKRIFLKQLIA